MPTTAVPTTAEPDTDWAQVRTESLGEDFAEFVRAALPGLLRYGHALAGNPHDAADLVQGVLERIGARWTSVVRRTGDPLAYARRAMANAHVSRWRRTRRENLVADLPDTSVVWQPDRFADEPLWQALRALPPRQRAVIVLRYYEDLSEAEIARTLGIAQGTVKSQANKAMTTLRTRLGAVTEREGDR
ncbi:MAG TPA: SigE family RNA polymerase sigma factor [Pseudonocardiaceae bacterium]|nr:SigE family RNA polymerase sigma factor [Pseudonocardiaceae bacterium]